MRVAGKIRRFRLLRPTAGQFEQVGYASAQCEGIMRFILIDKVISFEKGRRLKAVKGVSLAEEYLGDHFPKFPVLPGVLMLQGLIESASWLVRNSEGFAHSMILLEEAKNVRYKSFLPPGAQVEYTVEARAIEENVSSFSGVGVSQDERIVEARFALRHFNLADNDPTLAAIDGVVVENMKIRWKLLWQGNPGGN